MEGWGGGGVCLAVYFTGGKVIDIRAVASLKKRKINESEKRLNQAVEKKQHEAGGKKVSVCFKFKAMKNFSRRTKAFTVIHHHRV